MLSHQDNELLTRVGAGTPMGELMRRYWIPAGFSDQIAAPDGPPLRVRLLGEDLVLFRATDGRVGLLDERCPHRTASLFYGRNEQNGLRCVYHGIKFDVEGQCIEVPCVPFTDEAQLSNIKAKLAVKSYPCIERGGVIWAYMGPAEFKPEFPDLEWTLLPESHHFVSRHIQDCNWLQALEGGFDAPHLSFLHRGEVETSRRVVPSFYEVMATDFGFVVGTGRDLGTSDIHWNVNVMLMPFHKIISSVPMAAHVWVPIDDQHTMLYSVDFNANRPLNEDELAYARSGTWIHSENAPGSDRAIYNQDNDYGVDRALQASGRSFTGIKGIGTQDCAIQESMGPIADRGAERLLPGDAAIVKLRRLLLDALDNHAAGKPLPGMDPASYRVRSTRCAVPKGEAFAATMEARVRSKTADTTSDALALAR